MNLKTNRKLLIVPHIWGTELRDRLTGLARSSHSFLNSQILQLESCSLLTGFLGYPHLLTLLGFIDDIMDKDLFFLGTAGIVNPHLNGVQLFNPIRVHASTVFHSFPAPHDCELKRIPSAAIPPVSAVSVDIPQRETPDWLREQRQRGIDLVDMELFPLCHYIGIPITALLVSTDRVTPDGIEPFAELGQVRCEFERAVDIILEESHEA